MLIRPPEVLEEIDGILSSLESGETDSTAAGERIRTIDPKDGAAYLLLASPDAAESPAELERAESFLWEALVRQPCDQAVYLALADVRAARIPGDPLAKGLTVLGMWKLAMSGEIASQVAEQFRDRMHHPNLDWTDPKSYEIVANAWEEEIEEEGEPPEVASRLLPYRLLNRLQLEYVTTTPELAKQIVAQGTACAPVFLGALWEWGRDDESVDADTLRLVAAILGEIAGPEALTDLLELSTHDDPELVLHTQWGIHRLAMRFPNEAMEVFRSATRDAYVALRCVVAEQIAMLAGAPDRPPALLDLIQDFKGLAGDPDAAYLLMAVSFGLEQAGSHLQARETLLRFERLLPKEGKQWLREMLDDGFVPMMTAHGINLLTLEEVVVGGELRENPPGEADEWDEDEEEEADEAAAVLKPGRNEPCWCGSGKKYKKCHLDEDEEKGRAGPEASL